MHTVIKGITLITATALKQTPNVGGGSETEGSFPTRPRKDLLGHLCPGPAAG